MLLETNIRYLPLAYQCAIEWVDAACEDRTQAKLITACEHFEKHQAVFDPAIIEHGRLSAAGICSRRFWNWKT